MFTGKTILLVEDEVIIALSEKLMLEKEGYEVHHVTTGEAAVKAVSVEGSCPDADLILMDINLGPGIDGTDTAKIILSTCDIPILFLSSHTEPEVVEKTEKITSYGYVVKSSPISVLGASIKMAFKLFEAKNQVKEVFASSINGICIHEMLYDNGSPFDCRYLKVNESFYRHTGIEKELEGTTIRELYPNNEADNIIKMYAKMLRDKTPIREEIYFEPIEKWFELSGFLSKRSPNEFIIVIQDITNQKKSEIILHESEQRFKELFELAPLGYQSLDEDGRFLAVNQAWVEIFGYSKEEVVGKWFGDFLAPEHTQLFKQRFPQFKEQGSVHTSFEMLHKNGKKMYVTFDGRIGYNADGSFKQTHCILSVGGEHE